MGAPPFPRELTLPSGEVVRLSIASARASWPVVTRGDELFGDAIAALDEDIAVTRKKDGARIPVGELALGDFHVLRAVLTRAGALAEDAVEITCRNCGAAMSVRPCARLEIAPWVDGEVDDEELDTTLPFGEPIEIPEVEGGDTVTFAPRTVAEARPLFAARRGSELVVTPALVRAMGIASLGRETDAARIAEILSACDDDAFGAVTDAFLASHYVLRLGSVVLCEACGARNDVDAPYEREVEPAGHSPHRAREASFPSFDAFAARARAVAAPMLASTPVAHGEDVELVVDDGTPAVDDGGEPLLGSYLPPHKGDMTTPSRAPTVTLYFRTFLAMWEEDGPYDWEDELHETIEHELEHHVYFLRGEDPMDEEERAVIRDEARRVIGKKEIGKRALRGFGADVADFVRRTWPLWVLALVALAAMLATQRE